VRNHVDEEDKLMHRISASGQNRNMTIINESGLYSLILKSKLPSAKKFKRWVTSEVLPAIRKHGGYLTPEKVEEALLNPDTIIQLATKLKEERTGRLIAEQKIAEYEPKI
ncbi:BRO-N domain-containing protein, partial [Streptococcus pyogenes]